MSTTTRKQPSPERVNTPSATIHRPEFFSLPSVGRDPYFGFSRSAYYNFEKDGLLELTRVRRKGCQIGRVFVAYEKMACMMRRLGAQAAKEAR